jgi:hypothetical protein
MPANDPRKARLVWARAPSDRGENIRLAVQSKTTRPLVHTGRLRAIGEFMGLILLEGILQDPPQIYQGIKRPYFGEGLDNFVYAYTCDPLISYTYSPRDQFDNTGPHEIEPPRRDSVFTVFVTLARPVVEDALRELSSADQDVRGTILGWEWTKATPGMRPRVPEAWRTRYRRRVWPQ